jgi:3-oxoacyl-[acyl-carrier protein] reductase
MDLGLADKVVMISGGSKGIGKAIASAFAREKSKVSFCARTKNRLLDTLEEIKVTSGNENVIAVEGDMSKIDHIRDFVDKTLCAFGNVDVLVNNAGSNPLGKLEEISDDIWFSSWSLKFLGYVRLAREVLPHMRKKGEGGIINVIGAAGRQPIPDYVTGSTINAALINFTKYLAGEAVDYNIRVNGVNPGIIRTERLLNLINKTAEGSHESLKKAEEELLTSLSIKKIGAPEDIANIVLFLASEKSNYINGEVIEADGGLVKCI